MSKRYLTPQMKELARLVVGAARRADVRILRGSGSGPRRLPNGSVYVGEHFWWGFLVPMEWGLAGWEMAIADWQNGQGTFFTSGGERTEKEGVVTIHGVLRS